VEQENENPEETVEKPQSQPAQTIVTGDEEEEGNLFNLNELGDIPLRISVQLGNTDLKIEEILKLEKGSIIGIEKLAGDPLEFYIGKRLAARGEVVVINEKYGLRLTEIINPEENS
jgi:flagellar motor switch protein FliN/FliY